MKIYTVCYQFDGHGSTHAEVVGVASTLEQAQEIMKADFDTQNHEYQNREKGFFDMGAHIETNNFEYMNWAIQEFDLGLNK